MTQHFNHTGHNRLWMIKGNEKTHLSTVGIEEIYWHYNGDVSVILVGFLHKDKFLLDIWKDAPDFEVKTNMCGNPSEYDSGKTLVSIKDTGSFECWTNEIVLPLQEMQKTLLYCQFRCKEAKICDL